jgi:hypothetical protein
VRANAHYTRVRARNEPKARNPPDETAGFRNEGCGSRQRPAIAPLGTFDGAEVRSEEGKVRVSRNPYQGGTRAILRELGRLLREQGEALKRIR